MPKPFTEYQKEMAFDQYYAMGEQRDLKRLQGALQEAEGFTQGSPAYKTIRKWSAANNWVERCKQRDLENSKKVQAKTDRSVVNTKADYRKMIKENLEETLTLDGYTMALVGGVFDLITKKSLKVTKLNELLDVIKSHQFSTAKKVELIKTDLLLMGEADSRSEEKIIIVNDLEGAHRED